MGGWKLQPGYVIYCGALFSLVNSRGAIKIHQATAHVYYKNNSKRREKASEIRLAGRCLKTQAASSGRTAEPWGQRRCGLNGWLTRTTTTTTTKRRRTTRRPRSGASGHCRCCKPLRWSRGGASRWRRSIPRHTPAWGRRCCSSCCKPGRPR